MRAALLQGEATLSACELFLAVAQLPEAFSDEEYAHAKAVVDKMKLRKMSSVITAALYRPVEERFESNGIGKYMSIAAHPDFNRCSVEELRMSVAKSDSGTQQPPPPPPPLPPSQQQQQPPPQQQKEAATSDDEENSVLA